MIAIQAIGTAGATDAAIAQLAAAVPGAGVVFDQAAGACLNAVIHI